MSRLSNHDSPLLPDADTAIDDLSTDDPNTPPSILGHLLPTDFDKASSLTPPMIKYHQNEYDRPGYGLAYIVSNAFEIAKAVSELSAKEIGFHLDLCRLCVALTRENRKSLGLIIKEVIYYFTDVASHDLSNTSIQDKFSNEAQLSLQTKLPHLTPSKLAVTGPALKASITNLEDTACARNNVSSRGIFPHPDRQPMRRNSTPFVLKEAGPCTKISLVRGPT
jgi:hypothetical protein